jgi:hypothetical protein
MEFCVHGLDLFQMKKPCLPAGDDKTKPVVWLLAGLVRVGPTTAHFPSKKLKIWSFTSEKCVRAYAENKNILYISGGYPPDGGLHGLCR